MSRRKARNNAPNIPSETLERARRQAAGEDVDVHAPTDAELEEQAARVREARMASRRASGGMTSAPRRSARSSQKEKTWTTAEMDEILNNPTKTVTEEELHSTYGYVITDIRNMGILAAVLFGIIIASGMLFS